MDPGAGETQPEQLLDQTIRHCRKLFIAKKERLELEELCTTISGQLGDSSLAPKQPNYDDLKRKLVEVERRLAVWSNYNFFRKLISRRSIKKGIGVFIRDLKSIVTGVEDHGPQGTPPSVKLLNGVVTRQEENPWAEGRSCRVWEGHLNNGGGGDGSGEEIGGGGAGAKKVALKALKPRPPQGRLGEAQKANETEQAHEEFMSELLCWAELHHPNILPFYGIVTDIGTRLYMVFPWRENGNILAYVKDHPQVDKHRLLRDSAAGLSYLHSKGIVHGNVRCSNVFITSEGKPQICDFGIAKVFHKSRESEDTVSHTKSHAVDVRYAAPELIEHNDFRATTSSDTYSFALLILEFITQAPPFFDLEYDADVIHARVDNGRCPSRPDGEPHISDDLWGLMERCWSLEPESRPSMKAVHQFFCQID